MSNLRHAQCSKRTTSVELDHFCLLACYGGFTGFVYAHISRSSGLLPVQATRVGMLGQLKTKQKLAVRLLGR